ncbi:hypothetical protein OG478_53185 (plasmid) [Streptomyces phaeochromogenes]|uniref:hypothetical protein n=1 Tax=Streptomyces phaeochromogenes TaxID=1923 RepID=UPI002F909084|nr:hypothetical protein OG478_53185 [Streptomyces phaeochromogenes]
MPRNHNHNAARQNDGSRFGLAIVVGIGALIVGGAIGLDGVWWLIQHLIPALVVVGTLGAVLKMLDRRRS